MVDYMTSTLFRLHITVKEVDIFLNLPSSVSLTERYFNLNRVKESIQTYSLKKAPGFDLITAEVARYLIKNKFKCYRELNYWTNEVNEKEIKRILYI
ncbi:Reverse transcriptase domain-containing protein [Aphis craccivora]|uniref:Reverse transcriptase domain-containing protein n=1 Tax=Aphis craccivora TaxID=307492 RepID=A0A6G0ZEI3_APHCR|nr:Reverse transcriptase domain-containing protein [Aphis craccivora]